MQAKKSTILNASSYLRRRCVARRYTRFRGPTPPNNCGIIAEILVVVVPKMKVSYLLDILVDGVGNIDQLPVGEVGKKVPIGLPPILG